MHAGFNLDAPRAALVFGVVVTAGDKGRRPAEFSSVPAHRLGAGVAIKCRTNPAREENVIPDLPSVVTREHAAPIAVSVIIPARNAESTLATAVDSLIQQSAGRWEAIIIDDGSTDRTRAIADRLAAQDDRVRVTTTGGRGVSAARNAGMALAQYPWLLHLDADDVIAPHALARFAGALAGAPEADAAHCGWRYVAPNGLVIGEGRCSRADADLFPLLAGSNVFVIHACVVRRSLAAAIGGWDETLRNSEDFDFWQRVTRAGARFVSIRETLVAGGCRPGAGDLSLRARERARRARDVPRVPIR